MRILIDQSGYELRNMGDLAMLQVAIARLSSLWPDASIQVFTTVPERLSKYCPGTESLSPAGHELWLFPLVDRIQRLLPDGWATQQYLNLEWAFRSASPSLASSFLRFKLRNKTDKAKDFNEFISAAQKADLVVATGGGYITDVFEHHAVSVLDTLGLAISLGKPTAMFGQGLGPVQSPKLLAKARKVLPSVDLIGLREGRAGIPLLNLVGVGKDQIFVTGDDAIELVHKARRAELGHGIGVNLRFSRYSSVNQTIFEAVRSALQEVARMKEAPLLPVPISHHSHIHSVWYEEPDSVSIQKLLQGHDDSSDGGQSLDTPLKVIEQAGQCRVVVTGSYHAGVFALSQGIPIVGLAKSEYYVDKFRGLADQFGVGCQVVLLDDQQLQQTLVDSITKAWDASETWRPQLLESAQRQMELGQTAYKRVYELVNSSCRR